MHAYAYTYDIYMYMVFICACILYECIYLCKWYMCMHCVCMRTRAYTYDVYMYMVYVPALCMNAYTYEHMSCVCVSVYGHEADVPYIACVVFTPRPASRTDIRTQQCD